MSVIGMAGLIALAWKFVDFLKFLRNRDWNASLTQICVWAAGVGVVFLGAAADDTKTIKVGTIALGAMNTPGKVLLGLCVLSVGSVVYDFKKAFDNTDSAAERSLF